MHHGMQIWLIMWLVVYCLCIQHTSKQRSFLSNKKHYYGNDPFLFKLCKNQVIKTYLLKQETKNILCRCHASLCRGHFGSTKIVANVLQSRFYGAILFRDSYILCFQVIGAKEV